MKKILLALLTISFLGCTDRTDEKGFFIEGKKIGINKETKSKYDKEGYDKEGYNLLGYDKDGVNKEGYDKEGFNKEGYNLRGYDKNGYNKEGVKVKIFELEKKVGQLIHIIEGEFCEMKNKIRINHIHISSINKLNKREEFEEYFEIEKNENGYILTKKNENGEYFELNLKSKSFYFKDKEGIIPGYILNL